MDPIRIDTVVEILDGVEALFTELLRTESMNVHVYRLQEGTKNPHAQHAEDEAYYAFSGRAKLRRRDGPSIVRGQSDSLSHPTGRSIRNDDPISSRNVRYEGVAKDCRLLLDDFCPRRV